MPIWRWSSATRARTMSTPTMQSLAGFPSNCDVFSSTTRSTLPAARHGERKTKCGYRQRRARASTCCAKPFWTSSMRIRTWRAHFLRANATCVHLPWLRRVWMALPYILPGRLRSSCLPKNFASRRKHWAPSRANSTPTICLARYSASFVLASSAQRRGAVRSDVDEVSSTTLRDRHQHLGQYSGRRFTRRDAAHVGRPE